MSERMRQILFAKTISNVIAVTIGIVGLSVHDHLYGAAVFVAIVGAVLQTLGEMPPPPTDSRTEPSEKE